MEVRYVSDLHLEFFNYPNFENDPGGDVLILAGDIVCARYLRANRTDPESRSIKKYLTTKFRDQLTSKYRNVLYVPGNHEYYGSTFSDVVPLLTEWFSTNGFDNLVVIDNNHIVIDNVVFVGQTLWTDYNNNDYWAMFDSGRVMNDYRAIRLDDRQTITPEFLYQRHVFSKQYLDQTIRLYPNADVCVVSHHGPSLRTLNREHRGTSVDFAYASDLEQWIGDRPQIRYWVCGHSHQTAAFDVLNTTVVQNCRGYPGEHTFRNFNGTRSFVI